MCRPVSPSHSRQDVLAPWSRRSGSSRQALPPMKPCASGFSRPITVEVKYHTLYTIVRTRFKAKLKVPRPSHTKKP